ncbi:MAG: hypothetical protein ABJA70_10985 [Chryseolinea sp.]
MKHLLHCTLLFTFIFVNPVFSQQVKETFAWQAGYLDIHHINTARGNATFFIFPDGTTMLFDAGDKQIPQGKVSEYFPIPPNDSLSAGGWIARYIRKMTSSQETPQIDYAVISHFHNDHYGQITASSKKSTRFNYLLSGITEVGDLLPLKTLIDRGYPDYNFPLDLKVFYRNNKTFQNYLSFIEARGIYNGLIAESLVAGRKDQIVLKRDPNAYQNFSVRNVKANADIWTGKNDSSFIYSVGKDIVQGDNLDENALCLALKISYGPFDYYTGGDLNGFADWGGVDMETPVAKSVGQVEALALNHHGYYDATNRFFMKTLSPDVVIHQVIHDPHFQPDVLKVLSEQALHLFTYNMHNITRKLLDDKMLNMYKSTKGHILIRVSPGGAQYNVHILDDTDANFTPLKHFGPYFSR